MAGPKKRSGLGEVTESGIVTKFQNDDANATQQRERIAAVSSFRDRVASFREQVEGDETISDVTKKELLARLPELKDGVFKGNADVLGTGFQERAKLELVDRRLSEASSLLEGARKGTDTKFRARQIAQQGAELRADRPGLLQTRRGRI